MILQPLVINADAVEIDGIYYNLVKKAKIAEVTSPWIPYDGDGDGFYSGDIVIPHDVEYDGNIYTVNSIGNQAFGLCRNLTSITIPNSISNIGISSFKGCTCLASINMPNTVTKIGNEAFSGCLGLTSIVIPNSVISIGQSAFRDCSGLTSVSIGNAVTDIGESAFSGCYGLTTLIIPNSVTNIGNSAFSHCSGITSVTIPNSVTNIGEYAFENCSSLMSVNIPNTVTSIGKYAFEDCKNLISIFIPNSVIGIGDGAFCGCSGLEDIKIGNSVKSIGQKAFAKCPEITDVFCYSESVPNTLSNAFEDSYTEYATLHVHEASVDEFSIIEPWKNFMKILQLDKCATPTITYEDGEFVFDCETENVEYTSSIVIKGAASGIGNKVELNPTLIVTVYATNSYYDKSDVATKEIDLFVVKNDINNDNKVDTEDLTRLIDILLGR